MSRQDSCGRFGPEDTAKYMYNHLICSIAVIEAYARSRSPLLRDSAKRALDYTLAAQNPGRGWRYTFRSGDNDASVTGWGALVLHAGASAGFDVPASAIAAVIRFYDEVTDRAYGSVGYVSNRVG
jgi:hypothetical protein